MNNQGETIKALAFSTRFVRPALRSITFCFSVVLISSMTMVKLAHASGVVSSSQNWATSLSGIGAFCLLPSLSASVACYAQFATQNPNTYYVDGYCHTPISTVLTSATTAIYTFSQTRYPDCGSPYSHTKFFQVFSITCPLNSTPTGTACTCNDGYAPDSTATSCVPVSTCPVKPLTTPPFNDACSKSLELGHGVDVNGACGTLREPDMVAAASCIADKIHKALGYNVYTVPSSKIRTVAYQDHLLEIWNKSGQLKVIMNSVVYTPETKQACVPVNVDIGNELKQHGITHQPSSSGDAAPHVQHRAIDVPEAVANALMDQVTTYTTTATIINGQKSSTQEVVGDVEDYMHSATDNPPACDPNLRWGGRFDSYDYVHFQLP